MEEQDFIETSLLWTVAHYLGVGRAELVECVSVLYNDWRPVDWVEGYFKGHFHLSERRSRIYDSKRVTADDDPSIKIINSMLSGKNVGRPAVGGGSCLEH